MVSECLLCLLLLEQVEVALDEFPVVRGVAALEGADEVAAELVGLLGRREGVRRCNPYACSAFSRRFGGNDTNS